MPDEMSTPLVFTGPAEAVATTYAAAFAVLGAVEAFSRGDADAARLALAGLSHNQLARLGELADATSMLCFDLARTVSERPVSTGPGWVEVTDLADVYPDAGR